MTANSDPFENNLKTISGAKLDDAIAIFERQFAENLVSEKSRTPAEQILSDMKAERERRKGTT